MSHLRDCLDRKCQLRGRRIHAAQSDDCLTLSGMTSALSRPWSELRSAATSPNHSANGRKPHPLESHSDPLTRETANRCRETAVFLGKQCKTCGVAAMRTACAVEHRAKRQHVIVVRIVRVSFDRSSVNRLVHRGLHAGLQHANLDREIGQALQTNVLVIHSRIRHGGETIRLTLDGCKTDLHGKPAGLHALTVFVRVPKMPLVP